MGLSARATEFLQKCERDTWPITENDIRDAFAGNDAPAFQPLIEFQLKYGGYFLASNEMGPVKFTLLIGEGGYPKTTGTSIIEFSPSETGSPGYFFNCASIEFPCMFELDENGIYYENRKPIAASFDIHIERMALQDEIKHRKVYKAIYRDEQSAIKELDKLLNLPLIAEASDQFMLWFGNEWMYLTYHKSLAHLMVHVDYPHMDKLHKIITIQSK